MLRIDEAWRGYMAAVFSNLGVDISSLNFNNVYAYSYAHYFYDNTNATFNSRLYSDIYEVDWRLSSYVSSIFGGTNLVVDSVGNVISGTSSGYLESLWNGNAWNVSWGVQDYQISATQLYNAFVTTSTSDD